MARDVLTLLTSFATPYTLVIPVVVEPRLLTVKKRLRLNTLLAIFDQTKWTITLVVHLDERWRTLTLVID